MDSGFVAIGCMGYFILLLHASPHLDLGCWFLIQWLIGSGYVLLAHYLPCTLSCSYVIFDFTLFGSVSCYEG
jgi:hypothetical protein